MNLSLWGLFRWHNIRVIVTRIDPREKNSSAVAHVHVISFS
jgi:hypothetical protein